MKISVISFTETGQQLAERIRESMDGETAVTLYTKCSRLAKKDVYRLWMTAMQTQSASGTACQRGRESRWRPAMHLYSSVPVVSRSVPLPPGSWTNCTTVRYWSWHERGEVCDSLLSGHVGGANELAVRLAGALGAVP